LTGAKTVQPTLFGGYALSINICQKDASRIPSRGSGWDAADARHRVGRAADRRTRLHRDKSVSGYLPTGERFARRGGSVSNTNDVLNTASAIAGATSTGAMNIAARQTEDSLDPLKGNK
jgi:hypothetical protein